MANFTRQAPAGYAVNAVYPSAHATYHDLAISKAVNGTDGSMHDGDVTLGSLTTNRDVTATESVNVGETIDFAPTDGTPDIAQAIRPGTGANPGAPMRLLTQPGQAQTGGADNNDGAGMHIVFGAPGTGGSGAAAEWGEARFNWNQTKRWYYAEVIDLAASGTQTVLIPVSDDGRTHVTAKVVEANSDGTGGTHERVTSFKSTGGTTAKIGTTTDVHDGSDNTGVIISVNGGPDLFVHLDLTAGSAGATTTSFWIFVELCEVR